MTKETEDKVWNGLVALGHFIQGAFYLLILLPVIIYLVCSVVVGFISIVVAFIVAIFQTIFC